MTLTVSAQDQLAAFIAGAMPERILTFRFSSEFQKRIQVLVGKKKEGLLSPDEKSELEQFLLFDNMIGLAKARAVQMLSQK